MDRARFPRDKPCGGGLTLRAVGELPSSVEPGVEARIEPIELGFRYRRRWAGRAKQQLVWMTQGRRLDGFLAEQAVTAGAEFRDGSKVTAVDPSGRVAIDGERLDADVVVGADGANGITARSLGRPAPEHGVALEGNVAYTHVSRERFQGRAVAELGAVPGGYAERFAPAFAPLESISWRAKLAFERFPHLAFRLATTNVSWRLFQAVVRGDRRASDTHGLRGAPLRVLQALGV